MPKSLDDGLRKTGLIHSFCNLCFIPYRNPVSVQECSELLENFDQEWSGTCDTARVVDNEKKSHQQKRLHGRSVKQVVQV